MDIQLDNYLDTILGALHRIEVEYYERRTEPEFLEWLEQGEKWIAEGRESFENH